MSQGHVTVVIRSDADRKLIQKWAQHVDLGTYVEFAEGPRRTDEQNRKMWAMLGEISTQVDWYGQKLSEEDWKDMFTASIRRLRVVPGIDGGTFIPLGMRTSKLRKGEMADLLTLIEAFGAERGVVFRDEQEQAA
jgi:hypothetical protein